MDYCRKFTEKDYEDATLFKDFLSVVNVPAYKTGRVEERLSKLRCDDVGGAATSAAGAANNAAGPAHAMYTAHTSIAQNSSREDAASNETAYVDNTWVANGRSSSPSFIKKNFIGKGKQENSPSRFNDITIMNSSKFGNGIFESRFVEKRHNEDGGACGGDGDGKYMEESHMGKYGHTGKYSSRYAGKHVYGSSDAPAENKMNAQGAAYSTNIPRKRDIENEFFTPKRPTDRHVDNLYKRSASTTCVLNQNGEDSPFARSHDSGWTKSNFYSFDESKFVAETGQTRRFKSFDESIDHLRNINKNAYETTEDGEGFVCAYCEARYIYKRCLVNHLLKSHRKIMKLL